MFLEDEFYPIWPILYNIYVSDQPTTLNTLVADYADDKLITSTNQDPIIASTNQQNQLNRMENWFIKWRFKANQIKKNPYT